MDGIESFSWEKNTARVAEGFKGGSNFGTPNLAPSITIADPTPSSVDAKLKAGVMGTRK